MSAYLKILEPFVQEHNGTKTCYNGTGLGMNITKNLIEYMGGTISIYSELGKGSTFTFTLQIHIATTEQITLFNKQNENNTNTNTNFNDLKNKHILLCEDHPLNAKIATRILEKWDCAVSHAENGKIGVEIFENSDENSDINYFDAILMDIRMPVMDGLEATRRIRASNRQDAKNIPIIALSANAFDEDREKSTKAGMNEHIAKPIDFNLLYKILCKEIKDYLK